MTVVIKRKSNSQTCKMLLQHQSSETIQGCLASIGDRQSRSEEADLGDETGKSGASAHMK